MKALFITTATAGLLATSAAAQDLNYAEVELSYNLFTDGGDEFSTTHFSGGVGVSFGQFDVALETNFVRLDGGGGGGFDIQSYLIEGAYNFSSDIAVGLTIATTEVPFDAQELELFVRYDNGTFFGEASFGRFFDSGAFDAGIDTWALTAGYDFGQGTQVWITATDIDGGTNTTMLNLSHDAGAIGADVMLLSIDDEYVYQLDGSYAINDRFDALAHLSGGSDLGSDLVGIGARYNLNDSVGLYGLVGRLNGVGDTAAYYGFGLTYDLGPERSNVMTGTASGNVFGPLLFDAKFPAVF